MGPCILTSIAFVVSEGRLSSSPPEETSYSANGGDSGDALPARAATSRLQNDAANQQYLSPTQCKFNVRSRVDSNTFHCKSDSGPAPCAPSHYRMMSCSTDDASEQACWHLWQYITYISQDGHQPHVTGNSLRPSAASSVAAARLMAANGRTADNEWFREVDMYDCPACRLSAAIILSEMKSCQVCQVVASWQILDVDRVTWNEPDI